MAYVEWEIRGHEFVNCNCAYGCPCQFNALPTHGFCTGVAGIHIEQGYFGTMRLDGLRAVWTGKWPGPIHEGNGTMQVLIDERADAGQREALRKIFHGEETVAGATIWNVFLTTMSTVLEPVYTAMHCEIDVSARRATLVVPGRIQSTGVPIRNPVTGAEHRARVDMPEGFEFTLAEVGSGTSKITAGITMELTGSHGHFADLHIGTRGVVR
jgi:hypothetical protein